MLAPLVARCLAVLLTTAVPAAAGPESALREHHRYTLSNGLTVILHPVDDVPLVRVHVRYHVGGVDEPMQRRGLAHIVEHLTFEDSEHISAGARDRALYYVGATETNASTSLTSTDYITTVPADYVEMALWIEGERMGYAASTVTRAHLRAVQRVVANERRQGLDAEPYATLGIQLAKALYPAEHPFHAHHIGSLFDIAAATPAEARTFMRRWYHPANATLVLVGDLPPPTRTWIEKYFGSLPGAPPPSRVPVAAITPSRELALDVLEPLGKSAVLVAAWPTPAIYTAEDAVADVLAEALAGGGFVRLSGRATEAPSASFRQQSLPVQSRFFIELWDGADTHVEALTATLDRVLAGVAGGALTELEIRHARERTITDTIAALQTLEGRAARLHDYAEHRGDPDWLAEDLQRYRDVTPAAVARFASTVLHKQRRVILRAVPTTAPAATEEQPP